MTKPYKHICTIVFLGLAAVLAQFGHARTISQDVRNEARELTHLIEDEFLVLDKGWPYEEISKSETPPDRKLRILRSLITTSVMEGETDISENVALYRDIADEFGNLRDRIVADFFEAFILSDNFAKTKSSTYDMETFFSHNDWFVRHRAAYFKGLFSPQAESPTVALQDAQDTFSLIPEEDPNSSEALYIVEAKILSISDIAYMHNLLGNPELSIPTSRDVIRLQKEMNEPVNGSAIINNLIFAFSMWRDHSMVKSLTETLLRLEQRIGSEEPGLTEYRASNVYIQIGDYEKSLEYANKAIRVASIESLKNRAKLNRIISLASLGSISAARSELLTFENTIPESEISSGNIISKISHIKSLIAAAEGDMVAVHRYTNARLDAEILELLTRNNSETANMLASLQNSKERRSEREDALEREAELKQVALERQQRIIWLLFALALIMTVLTIGMTAFARFRFKAAREMELAAEKALAGEKVKSEFLAVMSHELRTPLNGILGMADVVARTTTDPGVQSKNEVIMKSGNELLALVENIFDMTLIESGDMVAYPMEVNLRDLLTRHTEEWRSEIEAKGIIYTVHIDETVPEKMEIDRDRLRQCLKNLLSNAAKFTEQGRVHVHITTSTVDSPQPNVAELKIIIADTGLGMAESTQERLFKPFVQADNSMTREYGGAGLGLVITRSLARIMGGDLTVNSREGRGSEFILTVQGVVTEPASVQNPADLIVQPIVIANTRKPRPSEQARVACSGQNFLIVEDDIPSQNVVQSLLERTGARMTCVTNGQAALEALTVGTFDIVIMDIRMPGMDGVTAIRRIRSSQEAHSNVPIIALTADATPETNAKCLIAGVNVYLTKPVRSDDFYEAIEYVNNQSSEKKRKQA